MLKHIEDDGDLSVLVNDAGDILLLCTAGHHWVGSFKPVDHADASTRSIASALQARGWDEAVPGLDVAMLEAE